MTFPTVELARWPKSLPPLSTLPSTWDREHLPISSDVCWEDLLNASEAFNDSSGLDSSGSGETDSFESTGSRSRIASL